MTSVDLHDGFSLHGQRLPLQRGFPGRLVKKALSRVPSPRFLVHQPVNEIRSLKHRLSPVRISLDIGSPKEPLQWKLQPRMKTLKPLLKQGGRTISVTSPESGKLREFLLPLCIPPKGASGELKGKKWKGGGRRSHSSTGMVSRELSPDLSSMELQGREGAKLPLLSPIAYV